MAPVATPIRVVGGCSKNSSRRSSSSRSRSRISEHPSTTRPAIDGGQAHQVKPTWPTTSLAGAGGRRYNAQQKDRQTDIHSPVSSCPHTLENRPCRQCCSLADRLLVVVAVFESAAEKAVEVVIVVVVCRRRNKNLPTYLPVCLSAYLPTWLLVCPSVCFSVSY